MWTGVSAHDSAQWHLPSVLGVLQVPDLWHAAARPKERSITTKTPPLETLTDTTEHCIPVSLEMQFLLETDACIQNAQYYHCAISIMVISPND